MCTGEWLKLAPFRILSVDIECAGRKVKPSQHPKPGRLGTSSKIAKAAFTAVEGLADMQLNWLVWPSLHPGGDPQVCPTTRWPLQGHFPEAEKDPVIQIASLVTEQGKDTPTVRNVMTLKSCAPIVGAEVMAFDSEAELLKVRDHCRKVLRAWVVGEVLTYCCCVTWRNPS